MKFSAAIDLFIKYQITIERSPSTIQGYNNDLQYFRKYLINKYNIPPYLDDITNQDVEDYLYYLKNELGYTASSRKRKLASLRSFYKYCYQKKYCSQNITVDIQPIKQKQVERAYLTEHEVNTIVVAIEHPLIKLVIQSLYYTGMRISECLGLTLEDINFEKKYIHVINGKGGKDRIIPLNQKLADLLLDYKNNWRPDVGSDLFFCTEASGGLNRNYVNKVLQKTLKELNYDQKITAHTFRHSFASSLLKKNVDIVKIQKLLGHTSLVTTSIYTHTNLNELEEAVNHL